MYETLEEEWHLDNFDAPTFGRTYEQEGEAILGMLIGFHIWGALIGGGVLIYGGGVLMVF